MAFFTRPTLFVPPQCARTLFLCFSPNLPSPERKKLFYGLHSFECRFVFKFETKTVNICIESDKCSRVKSTLRFRKSWLRGERLGVVHESRLKVSLGRIATRSWKIIEVDLTSALSAFVGFLCLSGMELFGDKSDWEWEIEIWLSESSQTCNNTSRWQLIEIESRWLNVVRLEAQIQSDREVKNSMAMQLYLSLLRGFDLHWKKLRSQFNFTVTSRKSRISPSHTHWQKQSQRWNPESEWLAVVWVALQEIQFSWRPSTPISLLFSLRSGVI